MVRFLIIAALWAIPSLALSQPCSLDLDFNPALDTNAQVYVVTLQPNGQILIGGSFKSVGNVPLANVARLNPDGSLDGTFDPGVAADVGYVTAMALQPDGKVVVGGSFGSSSGAAPANLARLNPDGTVDLDFDPNLYVDASVNAVVMQTNGMILFGGSFGIVDGLPRKNLARLNPDGSLDSAFDACVASSAGSGATALAVLKNGKILVSGSFTFSTGFSRDGIARLSACGELDTGYAPTPGIEQGATAYTFVIPTNGHVVLGGDFRSFHTIQRPGLAQLTTAGGVDFIFAPGTGIPSGTTIYSMGLQSDGKILIGGNFNTYNEQTIYGVARINPDGSLDTPCDPGLGPNNSVSSFAFQRDGRILVAGKFTTFNNVPRSGLARLNGDHLPFRLGPPSRMAGGQSQMMFHGETNTQYSLQSSSNLVDWATIQNFTATNTAMPLTDPQASDSRKRFYRALVGPVP